MAKILLLPLRLAVGYGLSPRILGHIAIVMLVILRITIGYHFLSEGTEKYHQGDWTAKPFFANATGPFAGEFRKMVWDYDGAMRLDMKQTQVVWATYRDAIGEHYGFSEEQNAEAQRNYAEAVEQYEYVTELNANEIEEFQLGVGRVEKLDSDPVRDGVSSLGGQRETVRRELTKLISPTLDQIDMIWENYETAQNQIATDEQIARHPPYRLVRPRLAMMDTSLIDVIIPYFDIALGWCLILGLFTSVASLALGVFLFSVFLSQFPPTTGPGSSNYQLIESLACFVLAATGAGRFAGLDFFLHLIVRKVCGSDEVTR
ncbi:putative membrane protein YphA (DoxX/SURF4 family) [Rhodopirellula rubra]|uniref:Putative membrane protein YphA (DoxX/SURF4 family) n=1 Tax=Aporhodopirellula rubra TaxID=980271 RepID=A0A7W5DY17_9BACT|nr:DoxX family protein [Aporhodopirellula rubra]MBB3206613.1 putative membrane protein YphA (DoxX/SURF4 family) [Aporhodopirellula rubra]